MARVLRRVLLGAGPAVLLTALITGCSGPAEPDGKAAPAADAPATSAPKSGGAGKTAPAIAAKAGSVGGRGTPCELPVSFDLAADWEPDAVSHLLTVGPFTLVCEIDAKPAGLIGFLRVWTDVTGGPDADSRQVLAEFLSAEGVKAKSVEYREMQAGEYPATEVRYLDEGLATDGEKARALVFATPAGVVLFDLTGLDGGQREQMLPAYELARTSVRAAN
jgi:hypothetical protein